MDDPMMFLAMLEAQGAFAPPEWRTHTASRFVLHYVSQTEAERDLEQIAARLEALRGMLAELLGADPLGDTPVEVVIAESADDAPAGPPPTDGATDAAAGAQPRPSIQATYGTDAPREGLERALVELVLQRWLRTEAAAPAVAVDGILGLASLRLQGQEPARADAGLRERLAHGGWIPLAEVLSGPPPGRWADYYQAATSLSAFLLRTYGAGQLEVLLGRLAGGAPPAEAVQAACNRPLAVLEKQWQASLAAAEPELVGMFGFFTALSPYLRAAWLPVTTLVLLLFGYRAPQLLNPTVTQFLIDHGLTPHDTGAVTLGVVLLAGLVAVQAVSNVFKEFLAARLGGAIAGDLRRRMFDQLQQLSLDFYVRARSGDLISRLSTDIAHIESVITTHLTLAMICTLSILTSLLILFLANWPLALISLVGLLLLALIPPLLGRRVDEVGYGRQGLVGMASSWEQENVAAHPTVKAFGLEQRQRGVHEQLVQRVVHETVRLGWLSGFYGGALAGVAALVELATIGVGVYLVLNGRLTLGVLVLFIQQVAVIAHNVQTYHWIIHPLQDAAGGLQRVQEVLAERPSVVERPGAPALPPFSEAIRFEDVTFSYTGEQVNLDRLALTIPAGQSVALVGGSGSGKTTVLNLLMRFYDPTSGRVTLDGHDVREVSLASLRGQIATVLQETHVFNASIRDNIRLGRLDASDAEVEQAARAAELEEFVASLPSGFDTVIGERGGRLSGGQRQRIAIARAILRNPRILVLDEPTSALDAQTEAAVQATLQQIARGRTVLTVTHRLAAAAGADVICVFDAGRMVEQGTHQELLARQGHYARLWQRQQALVLGEAGERVAVDPTQLAAVPLFRRLDPVVLGDLAARFAVEQRGAGDTIFEPGDPSDRLYIITRGEVEIVAPEPAGGERRLALLRDGQHFGDIALKRTAVRAATARAVVPTTLLVLEREQVTRSLARVLDLPDDQRRLVTWLVRRREATAAQAAAHLGQSEEHTRQALALLVTQGYLDEVTTDDEPRYRPRFGPRRASRLPSATWRALEGI